MIYIILRKFVIMNKEKASLVMSILAILITAIDKILRWLGVYNG